MGKYEFLEGFVVKFEGGLGGSNHFVGSNSGVGEEEVILVG